MKKTLATLLATSMMLGISATAFAAPIYEADEVLKNTVTGFSGGVKDYSVDLTHIDGKVDVSFNLGENASYYEVEMDIVEGGKQLRAEYNKAKGSITLRPNVNVKLTDTDDYEIEIEVLDRKSKETVAEGYTLSGQLSYDDIQTVESGNRYNNSRGVLYDFGDGASKVEVSVGNDVTLNFKDSVRGIQNLHLTETSNESIDYMFSAHDLSYLTFAAKPKFSGSVRVRINASEDLYLYQYANGKLSKIPGVQFDENDGFVFDTKQLDTFILADMPLTEGNVNESTNTVRPEGGSGGGSTTPDKNNPTTGASDMGGLLGAIALFSLAGASVVMVRKVQK